MLIKKYKLTIFDKFSASKKNKKSINNIDQESIVFELFDSLLSFILFRLGVDDYNISFDSIVFYF